MHFNINDTVAVLDDTLKGVVIAINKNIVQIKDHDDMIYSFDASELVLIKEDQYDLSKFSDIHNSLLLEKQQDAVHKKKNIFKKNKKDIVMEVDLHIHQLKKSIKGMDNYDILTVQLNTAKSKLEFAIQKGISKVVFIHGVGEGVLKNELTYLFNKYPIKYYDASYQKYGLGATEVYIYQNINS
ncbi:MAG: Smr/MutS family protein [Flavobacteriaceae bacterium]